MAPAELFSIRTLQLTPQNRILLLILLALSSGPSNRNRNLREPLFILFRFVAVTSLPSRKPLKETLLCEDLYCRLYPSVADLQLSV